MRERARRRLPAAVALMAACVLALTALTPTGASAATHRYGPITPGLADNVWGGYVATGSGFQNITGSWVEPPVTCNSSNDLFAPWVGIDGYGSQTVEQTGVEANCETGSVEYHAWYEMYPAAPVYWNDPVSAGDSFTGTVTDQGGGSYDITLVDNTQGWTEHTTQQLDGQDVSAEAVIESPTQSYPSFSRLDFSGISVNGQVFDSYNPQGIDSGGYSPGPLSNGAFSMTPGGWGWPHAHATHRPGIIRY